MPNGWLNIIENRPEMFSIQQQATNLSIVFKKPVKFKIPPIVIKSVHTQSTKSPVVSDEKATMVDRNDTNVNPMVSKTDGHELPAMKLPWDQPYWKIVFTSATSSADIWGRNIEAEDWVSEE